MSDWMGDWTIRDESAGEGPWMAFVIAHRNGREERMRIDMAMPSGIRETFLGAWLRGLMEQAYWSSERTKEGGA